MTTDNDFPLDFAVKLFSDFETINIRVSSLDHPALKHALSICAALQIIDTLIIEIIQEAVT